MCTFFSAISNGKGRTEFFKAEDIAKEMAVGNPKHYDWNSHTSIAHFIGLSSTQEDKWNKWEYNTQTKALKKDSLVATNDEVKAKRAIQKYLKEKNITWLENLYNYNSGNYNSGNYNSGDSNSGNSNSGDSSSGWFNTIQPMMRLFNKETSMTVTEFYQKCRLPNTSGLQHIVFVPTNKMTKNEKNNNPNHTTIGGYLKVVSYKAMWRKFWEKTTASNRKLFLQLPNFNKKIFKQITGITV